MSKLLEKTVLLSDASFDKACKDLVRVCRGLTKHVLRQPNAVISMDNMFIKHHKLELEVHERTGSMYR